MPVWLSKAYATFKAWPLTAQLALVGVIGLILGAIVL